MAWCTVCTALAVRAAPSLGAVMQGSKSGHRFRTPTPGGWGGGVLVGGQRRAGGPQGDGGPEWRLPGAHIRWGLTFTATRAVRTTTVRRGSPRRGRAVTEEGWRWSGPEVAPHALGIVLTMGPFGAGRRPPSPPPPFCNHPPWGPGPVPPPLGGGDCNTKLYHCIRSVEGEVIFLQGSG